MKKIILLIVLVLLVGCEKEAVVSEMSLEVVPSANLISLETDKTLYHSGEMIYITAKINSDTELKNITARFYGIHASRYRLDQAKTVDLEKGENIVSLEYNAPRCYGCSGISPGTYHINLDMIHKEDKLASKTVDVEIRQ